MRALGPEGTRGLVDAEPTNLGARQVKALKVHEDCLEAIGFVCQVVSPTSVLLRDAPRNLWDVDPAALVKTVAEAVMNHAKRRTSLQAAVEMAMARVYLPPKPPPMSPYDLRSLLASLDEVEPDNEWQVGKLWVTADGRP